MTEKVPDWVDKRRLCQETCLGDTTVDDWVRDRIIPPPKKRGGKLMWRWSEVDTWLEKGPPDGQSAQDNDRVVAMREAMRAASRR